jgi:Cof subfamily protein (haloacid dehalogenase superfamily)
MEKKKFFFFDYDGTLTVGPSGEIPESAKRTLDLLSKNGHFVAVATGRIQCDAYELCKSIGVDNLVSDGGNGLTINGKLIYLESLNIPLAIQLLDELEQKSINWAVTCENSRVRYAKNENFTREIKDTYMTTIVRPELDYRKLDQLYKVFISCDPEKQKELITLQHLPTVRFNSSCLFVEPDDKAVGIVKMIQHFNATQRDVVVFGDGMNDLKMFREEWTSIAMGNARDALKEKASFVTKSCQEDGIEYACKYFGWI